MTSDPAQNGPPNGRPPGNRRARRVDEGDLWADSPAGSAGSDAVSPPRARPAPRRAQPPEPTAIPPVPETKARPVRREEPQAQQPPAPRQSRPPVADDFEYEDDDDEYYEDDQPSLLGNPYVLAAVAVAGAIVLAVIVVLFFGRGDGDTQTPGTTANATRTPTATVEGEEPSVTGLAARSIAIATVREGPALSYLELGLLQADLDVDIVGRNEEATWFQIVFPPGTQLAGWVPDSALRLPDNVAALVDVAEPTPVTRPDVPTATTAPAVEETPTPQSGDAGPDLAVFIASDCAPGSEILITVTNAGTVELTREPIEVIVSNDGAVEVQQAYQADMEPGASASLPTGVTAKPETMAVSVVLTDLEDVDPSNNIASCSVSDNSNDNDSVPPPVATQGN